MTAMSGVGRGSITQAIETGKGGQVLYDTEYMKLDQYLEKVIGGNSRELGSCDNDTERTWSKDVARRSYLAFNRPNHLNFTRLRTQSKLD